MTWQFDKHKTNKNTTPSWAVSYLSSSLSIVSSLVSLRYMLIAPCHNISHYCIFRNLRVTHYTQLSLTALLFVGWLTSRHCLSIYGIMSWPILEQCLRVSWPRQWCVLWYYQLSYHRTFQIIPMKFDIYPQLYSTLCIDSEYIKYKLRFHRQFFISM
jgi:hypothetical protein